MSFPPQPAGEQPPLGPAKGEGGAGNGFPARSGRDEVLLVLKGIVDTEMAKAKRAILKQAGKHLESLARDQAQASAQWARIEQRLEAVARNQYELRKENEELRTLNKDGYFKFAVRVKGEDFLAFAVIMALGNRKAAAAHLKIAPRTFYHRVDQWSARGKDYQLMIRYMDWRKRSSRQLKVELNPSLQSGENGDQPENPETMADVLTEIKAADNQSYPALFAEVLQALERQNTGNWTAVRQELVDMIKDEV